MGSGIRGICARQYALAMVALLAAGAARGSAPASAGGPITRTMVAANADAEFQRMDANHDGVVTRAEIETYEQARLYAAAMARNTQVFDQLDQNHDGVLSRKEFARLIGTPPSLDVAPLIAQIDANHDGKIGHDEYRGGVLARFDRADTNHDGVLSAEEQRAASMRDKPAGR